MKNLGFVENRQYHKRLSSLVRLYAELTSNPISNAYCCSVDHALLALWAGKKVILELGDLPQFKKVKWFFRRLDSYLLKRLAGLVLTSEFYEQDYFRYIKNYDEQRVLIVENKLPDTVYPLIDEHRKRHRPWDRRKKRIGLIGMIRYPAVLSAINVVVARRNEDIELHIYGDGQHSVFRDTPNCFYHGTFQNPADLPMIYSSIDINLIFYDATSPRNSTRLALPNKLYESVAFLKPIVCSSNCKLEVIVRRHNLGCSGQIENLEAVIDTAFEKYDEYVQAMKKLDKEFYIDNDKTLLDFVTIRLVGKSLESS